ncbi:MAG: hypothetical protein QNJ97_23225 [Myxococcota bacterium]|nr:hypothetical protein [Myxococcota bacterium]
MTDHLIKAYMNLNAVLQNLEDLVILDKDMAALIKDWRVVIQFSIKNGPAVHLAFENGACHHGIGRNKRSNVKLLFNSPQHLNNMFDGKANPIPVKGFTRLGFLKNEFTPLTERLTYYLKPADGVTLTEQEQAIATHLTLNTAVYACRDLAMLDPICKVVAQHTHKGILQLEVLPDGPFLCLDYGEEKVRAFKGKAEAPMAKMTFRNLDIASKLLAGEIDPFEAIAVGDIRLRGQILMVDNTNILLDKVEGYLG